ncbi:MAG: DUF222 domain-containing protein [Arthrobacter sp.]
MEAVRDFITVQDLDRGASPAGPFGVDGVGQTLALLREVGSTAAGDSALWDFRAASDFAGQVEEISRAVDYLQLVAAGAVDRTRMQAAATATKASTGWTTGWRDDTTSGATTRPGDASGSVAGKDGTAWATGWRDDTTYGTPGPDHTPGSMAANGGTAASATCHNDTTYASAGKAEAASARVDFPVDAAPSSAGDSAAAADDGYRNTTEFMRARLRISSAEARRRLALAADLMPRQGFAGEPLPPAHGELGAAVACGEVASRAATIITLALDRVRHACDAEASARMEHALTRTAAENDPDFLVRVARNWADALDQDGAEPSEELLRQLQGAFIRKPRHGLQHLEIFATAEQFEHLLTVMNTATNPRTTPTETPATAAAGAVTEAPRPAPATGVSAAAGAGAPDGAGAAANDLSAAYLDLRSRPQKLLDGLVGGCKVALASGALPAAGGLRPQVMVTIDYRDLLDRIATTHPDQVDEAARRNPTGGPGTPPPTTHTGSLLFTGPVTASTARKIACDADIIPVLLGGEGRILDLGRAARVFPPHIRKALTARDQGCAFPSCTIPAPWCEAHHITFWSRGGTTGTDNGTLLCSHHHHLIHKEQWTIHVRTGIPWFIPPPHIDPRQVPRRNHYFHTTRLGTAREGEATGKVDQKWSTG